MACKDDSDLTKRICEPADASKPSLTIKYGLYIN